MALTQEAVDINLTPQELQVLSELDRCFSLAYPRCQHSDFIFFGVNSRQFGFLKLNSPEHAKTKALVIRVRTLFIVQNV